MNVKSLSDGDSYNEEENISENGNEEGYLFSSNLQWNGNNSKKNLFWYLPGQFIIMSCYIKRF